ncbi:hypothetical protein IWW38_005890 [Coemansia aciculifera]|uniref:Uncharacterized protein n=1 Tax=Coemansia aciculifera TaxID=417176 RepID=A0ACC1LUD0_9FUNG|nr:hypothetical protein IWW38_005890 [Coemansia aciculifera]
MGSRRNLPLPLPLFGQPHRATTPDSTEDLEHDDTDNQLSSHMTQAQLFSLFPPMPNTGDIERRLGSSEFAPLEGSSAFTTPVRAGRTPQQHYSESEYTDLRHRTASDIHTPLRVGQRKLNLDVEYMDTSSSPPLPPELGEDGAYVGGYSTPIPGGAHGTSALEMGTETIDEDFVQNVIQEGELERLTRVAMEETKVIWKQEIMDELRKQTDSLADDNWMY